jgi:sigma-B regulation protein RsbU (phosphoserine phosphatase)
MSEQDTEDQTTQEQQRVLVLDDDPEEVRQLREQLDGYAYEVSRAESDAEALEEINAHEAELLLVDPKLPDVDAGRMCSRLREGSETAAVPVILLLDPEDENQEMLEIGADDFLTRPFNKAELLQRVQSLLRMKHLHDDLLQKNRELEEVNKELSTRNRELELGMEMAHRLQEAMLPQQYPEVANVLFCHKYSPADAIGGDFFQIKDVGDDKAAVFLSDVSGHGMRAALVTSAVKTLLENVQLHDKEPGEILSEINDKFRGVLGRMTPQIFATGFLMIVDGANRTMSIASAGHPMPLLVRKEDMSVSPVMDPAKGGPAMGFISSPSYQTVEVELRKRDIVLGFTDGVYEVRSPDNEFYGLERMVDLVQDNVRLIPRDLIQKIVTETESFMSTPRRPDDVCLLAVEIH